MLEAIAFDLQATGFRLCRPAEARRARAVVVCGRHATRLLALRPGLTLPRAFDVAFGWLGFRFLAVDVAHRGHSCQP